MKKIILFLLLFYAFYAKAQEPGIEETPNYGNFLQINVDTFFINNDFKTDTIYIWSNVPIEFSNLTGVTIVTGNTDEVGIISGNNINGSPNLTHDGDTLDNKVLRQNGDIVLGANVTHSLGKGSGNGWLNVYAKKFIADQDQNFGDNTGFWFGDEGEGMYQVADNSIFIKINGNNAHRFTNNMLGSASNTKAQMVINEVPSATNPTFILSLNNPEDGIGGVVDSYISIIDNSLEQMRFDDATGITFNNDQTPGTDGIHNFGSVDFAVDNSYINNGVFNNNVGINGTPTEAKLEILGTSGEFLKVGTLTNNWGGQVAIGAINGNGLIISKINELNNTNRVATLVRNDVDGGTFALYDLSGNADITLKGGADSYINGGNVGIGNTNPATKLSISYANGANAPTTVTAANSHLKIGQGEYGASNNGKYMIGFGYVDYEFLSNTNAPAYIGFEETSSSGDTKGDLTFYTRNSTGDDLPSLRMIINDDGNVGIGVSSPSVLLDVESTNADAQILLRATGTGDHTELLFGDDESSTSGYLSYFHTDDELQIGTGGSTKLTIESNGNIGIGTISPDEKLEVNGDIKGDTIKALHYGGQSDFSMGKIGENIDIGSDSTDIVNYLHVGNIAVDSIESNLVPSQDSLYDLGDGNSEFSIFAEQGTVGDNGYTLNSTNDTVCQTFLVGNSDIKITRIQLHLRSANFPSGTLFVKIQETTTGLPNGTTIASQTMLTSALQGSTQTEDFEFISKPTLSANTTYAIVVHATGVDASNTVLGRINNSGSYSDGVFGTALNAASWTSSTPADMVFKIYYDNNKRFKDLYLSKDIITPIIETDVANDIININGTQIQSTSTIADNDATPDVSANNVWTYAGSANSVVVTDLDNPDIGAIYRIIGNSDTYTITINDAVNFNLSGNWTGGIDDILTIFVQADNDYIEISRSDN